MNRREFLKKASLATASLNLMNNGCQNRLELCRPKVSHTGRTEHILNRGWRFQIDAFDIGEKEIWYADDFCRSDWAEVEVPKAWDCLNEALWGYEGIGWYCTTIEDENVIPAMIHRLVFGRVNYYSKVWLNSELVGENIGGYLPFEVDVTANLKPDTANQLVLRVDNRPRVEWLPAASNIEWVQYGGILQPVNLVATDPLYLSDLTIRALPDGDGAKVNCKVEIVNHRQDQAKVKFCVNVEGLDATSETSIAVPPGASVLREIEFKMPHASLWSPDSPVLYKLTASLKSEDSIIDSFTDRFGVRTIAVDGNKILLNGRELKVRGVNRYDIYGKLGPTPPRELIIEDLCKIKQAGVNLIRTHYPNSPDMLSLFDEMGFLMIEELPFNWWGQKWWSKEVTQDVAILTQARNVLRKMIRRDKNHPCIIIWSMCNECATDNEIGIEVMRELISEARELDTTRLVTFVASGETKDHRAFEQADIVCFNIYYGIFMGPVAHHPDQLDSNVRIPSQQHIMRQRRYWNKPIIISEFGTRGIKGIRGNVHYSEDFQARYIEKVWEAISSIPDVSGGALWCWADYYHRREFIDYAVFGPYGVLTVNHESKESLKALTRLYTGAD